MLSNLEKFQQYWERFVPIRTCDAREIALYAIAFKLSRSDFEEWINQNIDDLDFPKERPHKRLLNEFNQMHKFASVHMGEPVPFVIRGEELEIGQPGQTLVSFLVEQGYTIASIPNLDNLGVQFGKYHDGQVLSDQPISPAWKQIIKERV